MKQKVLIISIFFLIICSGCVNQWGVNVSKNTMKTTVPDTAFFFQSNLEKEFFSDEQFTEVLKQIFEFIGINDHSIQYIGSIKGRSGRFVFSGNNGTFVYNNATGRVADAFFIDSDNSGIIIDYEKAQQIAESYARSKNPQLWDESGNHFVKSEKNITDIYSHGLVYSFKWRDYYLVPKKMSSDFFVIRGLNTVQVTVSPSGVIKRYSEVFINDDPTQKFSPDISEEEAWNISEKYFEQRGLKNILPSEKQSLGLCIWDDSLNDLPWPQYGNRHLAWGFDVIHKQNYSMGGRIMIDAHDGHIINLDEIG